MGLSKIPGSLPGGVELTKIPWVSTRGWWGYERYHGSLAGGGGTMKDTMGLYQGVVGLTKIPWVSSRGRWGYQRYHGSLAGGGGANKDTMGL